jgi:hypothetical protein
MKKFSIVYVNDNGQVFYIVMEGDNSLECVRTYLI